MLSVVVDGEKSKTITSRGLYKTSVECSGATTGEWDYNAWNLIINNAESNSKCNVEFTSNLTEEEYNQYIEAGVSLRRNTYRGKDISSYLSVEGDLNLYTQISSGRFNDIYVGDYIKANGKKWLIADLDNYLHTGDIEITQHHVTIIPDVPLAWSGMNATNTTEGGYAESKMALEILPNLISDNGTIGKIFGNHIIEYRNLLSNRINPEAINQSGNRETGASDEWDWYARKIDLMSEVNVYGTAIASSSYYDIGIDNGQYAIFRLKPELINSNGKERYHFWLKGVSSKTKFVYSYHNGICSAERADGGLGVRPRFLIG